MTVERIRLPNGMTLLLLEMHEAPVVALQAWVGVGSADESEETAGIAHLHEHMLFKGTARRGVGEIARAVEAAGGEINAWTSYDETVYHIVLAAGELGLGLDVLADALRESSFDEGELRREIEVVVEEIKRAHDVPTRRVSQATFALAYERHPYRRPVLGTEASVRGLSRTQMLDFYHAHYTPEKTTLVVIGDFVGAALVEEVTRAFGAWQGGPTRERGKRAVEPEHGATRVCFLREPVKEARLSLAWPIPALEHADIAAIDALSVLLGHGDSSRLFVETRRRRELVNDIYAYAYTPRDPGLLMVGAGLRADKLEPALVSLLDEVYRLREHLAVDDELDKAKVVILSEAAYQRETVQGEARRLGFYEVVAGDYHFEDEYRRALAQLTPAALRDVARRYLGAAPAVVVQVPTGETTLDEARVSALVEERLAHARVPRQRQNRGRGDGVEKIELDNGAILLVRETDAPVVALRAVAFGGQRWESPAHAGRGSLFSSVWGAATEELGPEALARRVAMLGGSLGAFSGRNTLGMRGEFIREKATLGLQLFCDAMRRPVFDSAELERERAVLIEHVKSREDNPAGVAFELFTETLYERHPYGQRTSGTEATLRSFSRDDMVAAWRDFAAADKLVVAAIGGIDATSAIDVLARELADGTSAPLPATLPPDPRPSTPRSARYTLDKKQAHVIVGGLGTTVFDDDRFGLEVLSTILSGQSGRLFADLRDRQSLAYAVSSSNLEGLDPGHFLVHIGTSPDKVGQALAAVYDHLARVGREPASADELERAKRYLVGSHAIELQRSGARAMHNALGERFGQGFDDYLRYPERINAITLVHVQQVAERYLARNTLVEVVVGPAPLA